jgi:hypothetical protein
MGAVMGEISKTAKASIVKEIKKTEIETPEQSIKKLRLDLDAALYVPSHRIRVLLNAYDAVIEKLAASSWVDVLENGRSYRVTLVQDEVTVEEIDREKCYSAFNELSDHLQGDVQGEI